MLRARGWCIFLTLPFMVMPTENLAPQFQSVVEQSVVESKINITETGKLPFDLIRSHTGLTTTLDAMNTKLEADKKEAESKKAEQAKLEKETKKKEIQYTEFELTFYTALDCENGYGAITCQGKPLRDGIVANNVIPQNTQLYLEGYGEVVVADKGSSNFNTYNRLDVYIARNSGESNSQYRKRVMKLGRQKVKGYIIK